MIPFLSWSLALAACCSPAANPLQNAAPLARHKIVCTVGMVADIVRNIAGAHARANDERSIGPGGR